MTDIEIMQIGGKEYISLQDAARYLGCAVEQLTDYVYFEKLQAEQIESRWLIEWQSVKAFAKKRGQKRRTG